MKIVYTVCNIINIFLLSLFFHNSSLAQDVQNESLNSAVDFRLNWFSAYGNILNFYTVRNELTNKHLFIYNSKKVYPNSSSQNAGSYEIDEEYLRYYSVGIGFHRNIIKNLFYRVKFDYSYFSKTDSWTSHTVMPYGSYTTTDILYLRSEVYTYKSWQLTPGFGVLRSLKKFVFISGFEIPIYLQSDIKGYQSANYYDYDSSAQGLVVSTGSSYTPFFIPGGYFVGASLFENISFNINKNISLGVEGSAGLIYYYSFNYINSRNERHIKPVLYYPSLTFSYKF